METAPGQDKIVVYDKNNYNINDICIVCVWEFIVVSNQYIDIFNCDQSWETS